MPKLVIRIRLHSLHKYCILKRNIETACTVYNVHSENHNKTQTTHIIDSYRTGEKE